MTNPQSALGPVIDYLLAQWPAAVQAVDPEALVQEGYATQGVNTMVMVACESPESNQASEGTRMYVELGSGRVEEDFYVPCYVLCFDGGVDQSVPRRRALAVFDAIVGNLRLDLTLGGTLTSGRTAELQDVILRATAEDPDEEGPPGRTSLVTFRVHCKNRY